MEKDFTDYCTGVRTTVMGRNFVDYYAGALTEAYEEGYRTGQKQVLAFADSLIDWIIEQRQSNPYFDVSCILTYIVKEKSTVEEQCLKNTENIER
jgi:hypothetical protein